MPESRIYRVLLITSGVYAYERADSPTAALAKTLVRLYGVENLVGFRGRTRADCLAAVAFVRTGPGQTGRVAATVGPEPVFASPLPSGPWGPAVQTPPLRRTPTMRDVRARIVQDFDGLTSIAA